MQLKRSHHCADSLPHDAFYEGPGNFTISADRYKTELPDIFCNKTESKDTRQIVVYERQDGRYAHNILELRAWKARRAVEILQVSCACLFWPGHHFWQAIGHSSYAASPVTMPVLLQQRVMKCIVTHIHLLKDCHFTALQLALYDMALCDSVCYKHS